MRPPSILATTGCVVPIFRANSICVSPARLRAAMTAFATANSSSRVLYAFRYSGSFIHFLCISVMRATFAPQKIGFARARARSISCRGVFCFFLTKALTITTRRPVAATYRTREIPLLALSRISHKRPSRCFTCGSPTCSSPVSSINFETRVSRALMSAGNASTSASTVSFRVSTVHFISNIPQKI